MRHAATFALLTRSDVIIVASVSCIYGLGSPEVYRDQILYLQRGDEPGREAVLRKLVDILYERNEYDFHRGTFRVRGDTVEVFPAYEEDRAVRISFFGDEVEEIAFIDPLTGRVLAREDRVTVFPASHYVTTEKSASKPPWPSGASWPIASSILRTTSNSSKPSASASAPCSIWR
jgi:excinuclease ABC subunit B